MGNTFYHQIKQNAQIIASRSGEFQDLNGFNRDVYMQNYLSDASTTNTEISVPNIKLECQEFNHQDHHHHFNPHQNSNSPHSHYYNHDFGDNNIDENMPTCSRNSNETANRVENDFLKYFEIFTNHQNQYRTNNIQAHPNTITNSSTNTSSSNINEDDSKNYLLDNSSSNDEEYSRVKAITLTTENGQEYKTTYLVVKSSANNIKTKNKHKVALRTMYFCQKCPYKLIDFSRFKIHLLRHKYELGSIKCRYCEYYDFTSFKMRQHESLHPDYHPIKTAETNEKMHSCHLCPHKTTNACQLRK